MEKTLKDILRDQMQARGMTVVKLRQHTGIAERYLTAFLEDASAKLPAAPYARGYLLKIAEVLELDGNALWEMHRSAVNLRSSGPEDRMPENRFALKQVNRTMLVGIGFGILAIVYLVMSANRFLGRPDLKLTSPGPETSVTTASIVMVAGIIEPGNIVAVGGEEVSARADGSFETTYRLEPGLNTITVSTKNPVIGRKNEMMRQVIYEPEDEPLTPSESGT